jgi:hypothetical protein
MKKKQPLTYKTMNPVIIGMMHDIEDQTGLKVYYVEKEKAITVYPPKGDFQLAIFYIFIESGEIILDPTRIQCKEWLLDVLYAAYKKARKC